MPLLGRISRATVKYRSVVLVSLARIKNTIQQKKVSSIAQLATNIKQLQEASFQNHVCPRSSLTGGRCFHSTALFI